MITLISGASEATNKSSFIFKKPLAEPRKPLLGSAPSSEKIIGRDVLDRKFGGSGPGCVYERFQGSCREAVYHSRMRPHTSGGRIANYPMKSSTALNGGRNEEHGKTF
jgi:hypothetical protein